MATHAEVAAVEPPGLKARRTAGTPNASRGRAVADQLAAIGQTEAARFARFDADGPLANSEPESQAPAESAHLGLDLDPW